MGRRWAGERKEDVLGRRSVVADEAKKRADDAKLASYLLDFFCLDRQVCFLGLQGCNLAVSAPGSRFRL